MDSAFITDNADSWDMAEGSPFTDLIKVLLQHIAGDAAAGKYARNPFSSIQVYLRARVIYNTIQDLIEEVETSDNADWDAFDKYTSAIPPLETILFEFHGINREDQRNTILPSNNGSIQEAISFIHAWEDDRKICMKVLRDLSGEVFTVLSNDARKHVVAEYETPLLSDDRTIVAALNAFFMDDQLNGQDIDQQILSEVTTGIRQIGGNLMKFLTSPPPVRSGTLTSFPMANVVIPIKTMMLVYILFAMIQLDTILPGLWDYLKSSTIWQATKEHVQKIRIHTDTITDIKSKEDLEELEQEWKKVEQLLLNGDAICPPLSEMVELLQLAARIPRPFHGRSVELIRMLYTLNVYSNNPADNATNRRPELRRLMVETIDALTPASQVTSDVKAFSASSSEYIKLDSELTGVLTKIEEAFETFNLSNELPAMENQFNDAVKVDYDHFCLMKNNLSLDV
ncbi:hypothetical protein BDZ97DRAFT_851815 [Flammula alnicola]|nr:hypothetical protein BDZ97DRAFT_851815 [Flammula alnicola]